MSYKGTVFLLLNGHDKTVYLDGLDLVEILSDFFEKMADLDNPIVTRLSITSSK